MRRRKHWTDKLIRMGACPEGVKWARGYPNFDAAWQACPYGAWLDWLLWQAWCRLPTPDPGKISCRLRDVYLQYRCTPQTYNPAAWADALRANFRPEWKED